MWTHLKYSKIGSNFAINNFVLWNILLYYLKMNTGILTPMTFGHYWVVSSSFTIKFQIWLVGWIPIFVWFLYLAHLGCDRDVAIILGPLHTIPFKEKFQQKCLPFTLSQVPPHGNVCSFVWKIRHGIRKALHAHFIIDNVLLLSCLWSWVFSPPPSF